MLWRYTIAISGLRLGNYGVCFFTLYIGNFFTPCQGKKSLSYGCYKMVMSYSTNYSEREPTKCHSFQVLLSTFHTGSE